MLQVVETRVDGRKEGSPVGAEARRDRVLCCTMMILFHERSRKRNAFQTRMGILLAGCHTSKTGLQIIHDAGCCESYEHNLARMRNIGKD